MNKNEVLEQCTKLVGENKIPRVFEMLESHFKDSDFAGEITQNKNRFNELQKKERLGIISTSEAISERNKIVYGLLELINNLKNDEVLHNDSVKNDSRPTQIINIINSKNVNTGNVNTGGGDFKAGDVK